MYKTYLGWFRISVYGILHNGTSSKLTQVEQKYPIRPIVTIKANVINTDAGYDEVIGWKLK